MSFLPFQSRWRLRLAGSGCLRPTCRWSCGTNGAASVAFSNDWQLGDEGLVWSTAEGDAQCGQKPGKIGRDADAKPGGCDNIRIDIDAAGELRTSYARLAD